MEASFISEGVYPTAYPMNGGRVSFVAGVQSPDTLIPDTLQRWVIQLVGGQANSVDPVGMTPSSDYRNFYFPHLGEEGATQVRRFQRVVYSGVYPGIDLHLYPGASEQKMLFVCAPGSDPSQIALRFQGTGSLQLNEAGDVSFNVLGQDFQIPRLFAYQYVDGNVLDLDQTGYGHELNADEVRFSIGDYDPSRSLVLYIGQGVAESMRGGGYEEYGLCWSTYFGGDRMTDINGSCVDSNGNLYVTGQTGSSLATFPQTPFSPTPLNIPIFYKGFVSKFASDHSLEWSSIFGGGGTTTTMCYAVTAKPHPNGARVYVGGYTDSGNFPTLAAGIAYYDGIGTAGIQQGFIFKTDEAGTRIWSTYFGEQRTWVTGMAMLGRSNVVFTGISRLLPAEQITSLPGSTHYNFAGGAQDAFVANLNGNDQLSWRTYYGGTGDEYAYSIVTGTGNDPIFVLGYTNSTNMPTTIKPGAHNATMQGGTDMFILQISSTFVFKWATYFGGPGNEEAGWDALAVNPVNNDLYVVGGTLSTSGFPLQPNGAAYFDGSYASFQRGFVTRFAGPAHNRVWCTFLGQSQKAVSVEVSNATNSVFVAGYNLEGTHPLVNDPWRYYQPTHNLNFALGNEEQDAFMTGFTLQGWMGWSTYFGGNSMYIEDIGTLVFDPDEGVIATGRHSKAMDITTYFPLHEPSAPGYFDPTWNGVPSGHSSASFISLFCSWAPKSIPIEEKAEAVIGTLGQGMFQFTGGPVEGSLLVYDTSGKLVDQLLVRPTGMGSEPFEVKGLSAGLYVLDINGSRTKLVITP